MSYRPTGRGDAYRNLVPILDRRGVARWTCQHGAVWVLTCRVFVLPGYCKRAFGYWAYNYQPYILGSSRTTRSGLDLDVVISIVVLLKESFCDGVLKNTENTITIAKKLNDRCVAQRWEPNLHCILVLSNWWEMVKEICIEECTSCRSSGQ